MRSATVQAVGLGLMIAGLIASAATATEALAPAEAAARLDQLLVAAGASTDREQPSPAVDDATFLRRASLDLIGQQPTPDEIVAFVIDPAESKRADAIDRLLADPRYGENWARYWRDVFLYRRGDERALIVSRAVVDYLTEAFNARTPWNEIATSFVTARGNVGQDGTTALIAAQWGQIPEVAAEASRIFMGVQIQCAQCHDHPTDDWSREQFHEFAAFFPRLAVRAIRVEGQRRGFEVVAVERERGKGKAKKKPKGKQPAPGREHRMPDLDDPSAPGTVMKPVFFVTGQSVELGTSDASRRKAIAEWITAPDNPWFARALVNRIWAELVGTGFYEPIDDLGPERDCHAPEAMQLLSDQFVAHGYDVGWLFAAIMATDAYARESRPAGGSADAPFAAACTQKLRADQVFSQLAAVVSLEEPEQPANPRGNYRNRIKSPRGQFNAVFGFDPSTPRDEIESSIPQALMLMNSPQLAAALSGKPNARRETILARLLAEHEDDTAVVTELYLRTLAREPTQEELDTCRRYLTGVDDRVEAFEDIVWALINSTEFIHRK